MLQPLYDRLLGLCSLFLCGALAHDRRLLGNMRDVDKRRLGNMRDVVTRGFERKEDGRRDGDHRKK